MRGDFRSAPSTRHVATSRACPPGFAASAAATEPRSNAQRLPALLLQPGFRIAAVQAVSAGPLELRYRCLIHCFDLHAPGLSIFADHCCTENACTLPMGPSIYGGLVRSGTSHPSRERRRLRPAISRLQAAHRSRNSDRFIACIAAAGTGTQARTRTRRSASRYGKPILGRDHWQSHAPFFRAQDRPVGPMMLEGPDRL